MFSKIKAVSMLVFLLCLLGGCTYNPFSAQNRLTGNGAGPIIGAAAGAGITGLLGAPRPIIILSGLGGGALGYYVTTLRYDAGGVVSYGGQVYQLGDFVGIDIPTDYLFEENTTRFLPYAHFILDSVVDVLNRYGDRSILVAGNTSGFDRPYRETKLSRARAEAVVTYLRRHGINAFKDSSINMRSIKFVGNGDRFPIANHYVNDSIRQNSHIFISAYLTHNQLDRPRPVFKDIGAMDDRQFRGAGGNQCIPDGRGDC